MTGTTYDLVGTTAEFDFSYGANVSAALPTTSLISAFGNMGTIVSITIGNGFMVPVTLNAGYFSHVADTTAVAQTYATTFDVGFSSSAASASYYTTSTSSHATGSGGPSNALEGYGALELGGALLNASASQDSVTLKGIDDTLVLDSPTSAQLAALPVMGFNQAGDQIVLNGLLDTNASITGYSNGVLSFSNNGSTYTLDLVGLGNTVSAANFTVANSTLVEGGISIVTAKTYAGDLAIDYTPCFLRGTMIATPVGEVAVEALRPGDLVTVLDRGGPVARPVTWVGGSRMRVDEQPDRDEASPVRIVRHAFAMNVPHRDLLVTQEHCILTEAGLVPARMLVNGASVLLDRTVAEYEYHHVELERHGILLAEGLSTESYLDTGNRAMFQAAGTAPCPVPGLEIAAPLAVARDVVEPIWARLAERAQVLGLGRMPAAAVTDQPDLRLLLDDGRELDACWHNRQRHMFHVPRGARPVRLLSRAAVPARTVGPFVDDRRRLGVAVERLVLWTGLQGQVMPASGLALGGWHEAEAGAGDESSVRWTDGNAALDLPCAGDETFLDVHVACTMVYPDEIRMAA